MSAGNYDLRDYQHRSVSMIQDEFNAGKRSVLLYLPTGSGKTVIGDSICREVASTGKMVLFLVNKIELSKQAVTHMRRIGLTVAIMQADNTDLIEYPDVCVATIQTINARGCRQARQVNLLLHVQLIEIFHRAVVQAFHLGNSLVRHIPAQLAHMHGKALRIARVVCQPVKMFYMHAAAPRTSDTPAFELQVDSPSGNRQVSYPQHLLVVTPAAALTTVTTDGCFFRRLSWITRAYRSPNLPTNFDEALKPGNANSARIDFGFFMASA